VIVAATVLVGCNDTHVARCNDRLTAQNVAVGDMGGWVYCDPSYDPDEQSQCSYGVCTMVVQWTRDGKHDVTCPCVWLWERHLDDYWLQVHAWMGVYEVDAYRRGRVVGYRAGVPPHIDAEAFRWAVTVVG
jgi:hypothetical protein